MFTGLIGELGEIKRIKRSAKSLQLTINAPRTAANIRIGDSIAVNGACLTVVAFAGEEFTVDVMPESVTLTTISKLQQGAKVNLEKTLTLQDGLDGHLVSGHVEGIGIIVALEKDDIAVLVTVKCLPSLTKYIVLKGSVAIDGISLTVTAVSEELFTVSIIPHTAKVTTLGFKKVGDQVNIETDILAKYVEKLLNQAKNHSQGSSLDYKKLLDNGFI
ncbi:MAG TPA: riboflavin synthase [Candidatus Avacidaminococcus intestinavium]|uniref:Riboflavin synthase n=1 Tax=Candidatus Avacidaminococcus intestinavium TaxID=2840684 RepID=A0A9D1MPG7_9FIRM|nr:riboflavin synthase [Candidatus Avacidaminococcus intestinavium]